MGTCLDCVLNIRCKPKVAILEILLNTQDFPSIPLPTQSMRHHCPLDINGHNFMEPGDYDHALLSTDINFLRSVELLGLGRAK
jgi:hypothetical protein